MRKINPELDPDDYNFPYRKPSAEETKALRKAVESQYAGSAPDGKDARMESLRVYLETYRQDLRDLIFGQAEETPPSIIKLKIRGAMDTLKALGETDQEVIELIRQVQVKYKLGKNFS